MNDEVKEKKKKKDENKFQDVFDTINEKPFSYFLKSSHKFMDCPNLPLIP